MFYAYLIVDSTSARLFVDDAKVTNEVINHLGNAGVDLRPYDAILMDIERYSFEYNHICSENCSHNLF